MKTDLLSVFTCYACGLIAELYYDNLELILELLETSNSITSDVLSEIGCYHWHDFGSVVLAIINTL